MMKGKRLTIVLSIGMLSLSMSKAHAQISEPATEQLKKFNASEFKMQPKYVARENTQLRTSPPHGFFNLFVGDELSTVNVGDSVTVVGQKVYPGLRGDHIWYLSKTSSGTRPDNYGWLYGGTTEEPKLK